MIHEIGPTLRTTTIHEAFAVYKDYDGNCPDGPTFATCATKELAEEVVALLRQHDPNLPGNDDDEDEDEDEERETFWDVVSWPASDGYEYSARWRVQKVAAERVMIATTVADAIKQVTCS